MCIQSPTPQSPHGNDLPALSEDRSCPTASRDYWMTAFVLACIGTTFVLYRAWVADDAFITLRHVVNVHLGHGPVFNPGERVQAFSHPLWFLLLVAGSWLLKPHVVAVVYGLALTFTTVLVLAWFFRRYVGRIGCLVVAFAFLFGSLTFVEYSTSGLETSLTILLVAVSYGWIASRELAGEPVSLAGAAWLCGLLVLNRPDYAILCAPIALGVAWRWFSTRSLRAALPRAVVRREWLGVLGIVVLMVGWYGFATIYYGTPLPNTAYAKTALPLPVALKKAWTYARIYVRDEPVHGLLLVGAMVFGLVQSIRRMRQPNVRGLLLFCLVMGAIAHLAYLCRIGGDFMRGRVYLPVIVGVAVLTVHLVGHSWAGLAATRRVAALTGVAAIVFAAVRANWVVVIMSVVVMITGLDTGVLLGVSLAALAALLAVIVASSVQNWRYNRRRWGGLVVLVLVAGMVASGVVLRYRLTFSVGLLLGSLAVSVLLGSVQFGSRRGALTAAIVAATAFAAVGSLCDLTKRRLIKQVDGGVADEWGWYAPEPFSNPFAEPPDPFWSSPGEITACREYAQVHGPITITLGAIGISSYKTGPGVRVIDAHGLVDAFVARGYAPPYSRIGHPEFEIPRSYLEFKGAVDLLPDWIGRVKAGDPSLAREAAELRKNVQWTDPEALHRFELVREVVSGPIFSASRFRKLPEFIFPRRPSPESREP
ncbi:MAG TPA: hypothetical protein PL151_06800 [Phycisphaerae bacterium]|nr:hypothetical protein [Phycisphaerae bacterium]HOQ85042.1 hypothetical protein [Phycisphaerae bacterium]HPU28084.1 hypothetical protein [Phycisphaerae bacterium]HQE27448.1 hypothetical protein [Phycisphaerae bacterium]